MVFLLMRVSCLFFFPFFFFFFIQAEDGIRVYKVTGVQTCALPICQLVHEGWSPDATCIELEPVTNGPDRVVQTILLGDAE